MSKLKFLIVEDDPRLAKRLKKNIQKIGYEVSDIAYNMTDAIFLFNAKIPDVAILDIELPENKLAGIELAKNFRKNHQIPILFFTQHSSEHILGKALDSNPDGFIKKSSGVDQLMIDIRIAIQKYFGSEPTIDKESIWIWSNNIYQRIFWNEICWIESKEKRIYIHTFNEIFPYNMTLVLFEKKISSKKFFRTHQSYIVNNEKIIQYDPSEMLLYVMREKGKEYIRVSKSYLKNLKSIIKVIKTRDS